MGLRRRFFGWADLRHLLSDQTEREGMRAVNFLFRLVSRVIRPKKRFTSIVGAIYHAIQGRGTILINFVLRGKQRPYRYPALACSHIPPGHFSLAFWMALAAAARRYSSGSRSAMAATLSRKSDRAKSPTLANATLRTPESRSSSNPWSTSVRTGPAASRSPRATASRT